MELPGFAGAGYLLTEACGDDQGMIVIPPENTSSCSAHVPIIVKVIE